MTCGLCAAKGKRNCRGRTHLDNRLWITTVDPSFLIFYRDSLPDGYRIDDHGDCERRKRAIQYPAFCLCALEFGIWISLSQAYNYHNFVICEPLIYAFLCVTGIPSGIPYMSGTCFKHAPQAPVLTIYPHSRFTDCPARETTCSSVVGGYIATFKSQTRDRRRCLLKDP